MDMVTNSCIEWVHYKDFIGLEVLEIAFILLRSGGALAYAGFHATGVLNDEIRSKLAQNRLIWLFLPLTHGVCALPSHPLDTSVGRGEVSKFGIQF